MAARLCIPGFGDRPVDDITARELLALLRQIEGRGLYETAKRLRSTCGMVFRYAIAIGRAERDPSMDLRGALTTPQVSHRATIRDPYSIGALLRAIEGLDGQPTTPPRSGLPHMFLSAGSNCAKRNERSSIFMARCGVFRPKR